MSLSTCFKHPLFRLERRLNLNVCELKLFFLELTHRCSLVCRHCGSDCVSSQENTDLPPEWAESVLDDLRKHYPGAVIVLSGGEPLCYPDFDRIAEKLFRDGFRWGMVSNGFDWDESTVRRMKELNIATLTISLDGLEDAHNWLRGHRDSFRRAVRTLEMIWGNPPCATRDVITCVTRQSLPDLRGVYDLLCQLGVPAWRITTVSPIGSALKDQPDLFLTPGELNSLLHEVREIRNEQKIKVEMSEIGYYGKEWECEIRDNYHDCRAGINIGGMMINGDFLSCPSIDRSFAQGNIQHELFSYVWENRYEIFRKPRKRRKGQCAGCSDWKRCLGGGFHLYDPDNGEPRVCYKNTLKRM